MALGMIGIEEAFRRRSLDNLRQLPSQIHRILHASVEALSTIWRMHVGGVAGQQNPSVAVGRSLPGHIGEPGDPRGTVDSVICPAYSNQRFAEIAQCRFGRGPDVLFGHHDPYGSAILVNHLTPSNLVLQPAEGMDAKGV